MGWLTRVMLGIVVAVFVAAIARADLHPVLGVRAVQLSDRIAEATLEEVASATPIDGGLAFQIIRMKVSRAIDEPPGSEPEIRVVRPLSADGVRQESDDLLTPARKGQRFLVLLRKIDRVEAPPPLKQRRELAGTFVVVTARSMADLTADDLTDLRQITEGVRQLDKDTRDEEIRDLAGALLVASDPTEIRDVEDRLLAIGARTVPFLKAAMAGSDSPNRPRLQSIIDEVDVPRWIPSPAPK